MGPNGQQEQLEQSTRLGTIPFKELTRQLVEARRVSDRATGGQEESEQLATASTIAKDSEAPVLIFEHRSNASVAENAPKSTNPTPAGATEQPTGNTGSNNRTAQAYINPSRGTPDQQATGKSSAAAERSDHASKTTSNTSSNSKSGNKAYETTDETCASDCYQDGRQHLGRSAAEEAPFGVIIAKPESSSITRKGEDSQDDEEIQICEPEPHMGMPQDDPSPYSEETVLVEMPETANDTQTLEGSFTIMETNDDNPPQQQEELSELNSATSPCPADTGQLECIEYSHNKEHRGATGGDNDRQPTTRRTDGP
ncbi:hypothetical protein EPH_0066070 [Eimeria praecox]|uniref:Uncharacterized protein n=1 Tax=Eimeria praecox TaxID=51316 RepID=U6H567_9EIME|nr:hypothetical protein EPH_0066070 [Eimeria praecox]